MLPFLNLGPLALPTGPLVYLLGVWLALFAVDRGARRLGLDAERHYALATTAVLAGFVGARLVFVLLHWPSYDDNLLGIVWPPPRPTSAFRPCSSPSPGPAPFLPILSPTKPTWRGAMSRRWRPCAAT